MKILKARFRITTPMFLGEATSARGEKGGQIQCAEQIRPTALKGALRHAWRSLNWARIRQRCSDDESALKVLHKEEGDLFGLAAKGGNKSGEKPPQGQSRVLLRVTDQQVRQQQVLGQNSQSVPQELQYLLGMGLYHSDQGLLRSHLAPGGEFTVELAMKPSITETQRQQVRDTLIWLGMTGSLGSRARKGFGSVSLLSLTESDEAIELPRTAQQYRTTLERLIKPGRTVSSAPFSAICAKTRAQISGNGASALDLLIKHGHEMGVYRGYGRQRGGAGDHRIFGRTAEANFKDDHDWAYAIANGAKADAVPRRAIFGLPHPYNLSQAKERSVKVESSTGRRGSPLIAHVHELPDGECLLVHLLLESQFLPEGEGVDVQAGKGRPARVRGQQLVQSLDWQVLHGFLERFEQKELIDG